MQLTVSDVAKITSLARPTARRLLLTLETLGYVRLIGNNYLLTPKTLELGTSYVSAQGMWDVVQPHLVSLVEKQVSPVQCPSSMAATSCTPLAFQ